MAVQQVGLGDPGVSNKRDPIQAQLHAQLADARRNQILDAATQVFVQKGFHAATIREIARTAQIADGTIYIYFKNKPDLLLGILNRINESERRAFDFAQGLTGVADVRGFLTSYVRHRLEVLNQTLDAFQALLPDLLTQPELRERYLREVLEPSFRIAEPVLQHWIAAGALRPVNVELALRAVPSLFLGLIVLRMLGDPAVAARWAELPEFISSLFFDGLKQEPTQ